MTSNRPRQIALTGASRGLGLEFTRLWLEAGHHVFAMARSASRSEGLAQLAGTYTDALHLHDVDVADDDSVSRAAAAVGKSSDAIDLLLNNAGVYNVHGGSMADLDFADWRQTMEINALGPIRVTRTFLPLLRKGNAPRVINMTSLMGSIADNGSGGSWAYRMSKTALNMASRNMGHELAREKIPAVVIHPGWVQTDMGGAAAPLTIEEAVASMAATIDRFSLEHSGGFYDRNGEPMPW
jgi:NAD(P)-dependent dehydrogenase (short-subunit alcohol dehydrogenase family)